MTNFIKNTAFILLLCCFTLGHAQSKELDSLIQKIDNKDAYIVLTKTTSPRIKGATANRIVTIGKIASPELIKILNSQSKGIIAHFILSEIWKNTWEEEVCCNSTTIGTVEIITVNGLEIRVENNVLSSTPESLKKNQQLWKKQCPA